MTRHGGSRRWRPLCRRGWSWPGPLAPADGFKLVEALADRVIAGDLPAHVVLQCSGDEPDLADLGELQTVADRLVPPGAAAPGIVLMADVQTVEEALAAAKDGARGST